MKAHVVTLHRWRQWMIFVCCVSFLVLSASGNRIQTASDLNPNIREEASSDNGGGVPDELARTSTPAPTVAPTVANLTTIVPTIAPSNETNVTTISPTIANTSSPTTTPVSPSPTVAPGTGPPSPAPTSAPSGDSTKPPSNNHRGLSFLRFVEKTIAYLILLVLALLGFGGTWCFLFDIKLFFSPPSPLL
jgi:hypothetical protein